VLRSVAVLRKGRDGERINWAVNLEDRLEVDIDSHDLMELVGIVLENAEKWARSKVAIRGVRLEDTVELVVEDDGKGLTDDEIEKLGQRGVRLDEQSEGHGLGIAIALEILRLNHGGIEMGRSSLGGLAVKTRFVAKGKASIQGAPGHRA
jgi:signal transduction histidine kinase